MGSIETSIIVLWVCCMIVDRPAFFPSSWTTISQIPPMHTALIHRYSYYCRYILELQRYALTPSQISKAWQSMWCVWEWSLKVCSTQGCYPRFIPRIGSSYQIPRRRHHGCEVRSQRQNASWDMNKGLYHFQEFPWFLAKSDVVSEGRLTLRSPSWYAGLNRNNQIEDAA